MYNTLVKELPFNNNEIIKIQLLNGTNTLINKNKLKTNINNLFITDIGIKNPEFKLTIICSILLVIISGIIMYFSWRI